MTDTQELAAGRQIAKQQRKAEAVQAENDMIRAELTGVKNALNAALDRVAGLSAPMTGWSVLLTKKGDEWVAVACVDNNNWPEDVPEFSVILPIPKPENLPDWEGV